DSRLIDVAKLVAKRHEDENERLCFGSISAHSLSSTSIQLKLLSIRPPREVLMDSITEVYQRCETYTSRDKPADGPGSRRSALIDNLRASVPGREDRLLQVFRL